MSDLITKLREPKIYGFAIIDTVASIGTSYVLAKMFNVKNPIIISVLSVPASVIVHHLLDIDTPLLRKVKTTLNN